MSNNSLELFIDWYQIYAKKEELSVKNLIDDLSDDTYYKGIKSICITIEDISEELWVNKYDKLNNLEISDLSNNNNNINPDQTFE